MKNILKYRRFAIAYSTLVHHLCTVDEIWFGLALKTYSVIQMGKQYISPAVHDALKALI